MTDLVVIRFLGDKEGDDIIDDLLTTDAAALSRGRAELDLRATAQVERQIKVPYEVGIELGNTAQVSDELQGETYIGKVIGIDYTNELAFATIDLTLIVPSMFFS